MTISSKLSFKKKINTVHNLITFSMVFINKYGWGGRFNPSPPPPLNLGVFTPHQNEEGWGFGGEKGQATNKKTFFVRLFISKIAANLLHCKFISVNFKEHCFSFTMERERVIERERGGGGGGD